MNHVSNFYIDNIGVLMFPTQGPGNIQLSNLINICKNISKKTYLVTGNEGYYLFENDKKINISGVFHKSVDKLFFKIINYIFTQLGLGYNLFKMPKKADTWIFMGGDTLLIPLIVGKILKKKIYIVIMGNVNKELELKKNENYIINIIVSLIKKINLNLCDKIILYSENLIKYWNMDKYSNKIFIANEHTLNFEKFDNRNPITKRKEIIGYIGRFSEEKGVMNLLESILEILKINNNLKFIIGGDGPLKNEIKNFIYNNNISENVNLIEWIEHDDLPNILNELKLIILPSYTEGLPNILIESMACGTPVLATSVGSIPDIISNEENGFIMDGNSPKTITKSILKILEFPNLQKITINANETVKERFNINYVSEKWLNILKE